MRFDLRFYLSVFLRRLHYFVLIAVPVAVAGLVLAYTLPPVYRAEARLLVESPQIPGDLAASTVRTAAPELLQVISQRLLTRANLLDISQRLGVHDAQAGDVGGQSLTPDQIVTDMRSRLNLRLPGQYDAAAVVTIAFDAPDPVMSARVSNEFVTQFLQENVALRTAASGQTLTFFEQEVARLSDDLARQSARILQFKLQNKDALPDSLEYRRTRQASQQERLLQLERELANLAERRNRLVELYDRTGQTGSSGEPQTAEQAQLRQLKSELATALVIYSPQNPRIKALRAQVGAMERIVDEQLGLAGESDAALTAFDLQLADLDGQMTFLADQKGLIEQELTALAASIDATPANSITLGVLERDYDNIRLQYNQETASLAEARTGDRIEAQSRGQRMTVLEEAVVPAEPTSPNRRLVALMGVAGGIGAGGALLVLLELLNSSLRRTADFTAQLGFAPFVTVPYITTRRQMLLRRAVLGSTVIAVVGGLSAGIYMVQAYYMPMDMLLDRVVEKTGLGPLLAQLRNSFSG